MVAVAVQNTTPPAALSPSSSTPWGIIIGIVAAILVIGLIITLVMRNKS